MAARNCWRWGVSSAALTLFVMLAICTAQPPPATALSADKGLVVLLHGLGRSETAMWPLARRLEAGGYRVERIGYDSLQETPSQILSDIERQIATCCLDQSTRLHFVGHSLGGLLIRAYLANHRLANLGRVVLIGTPNRGTPIVDNLRHKWWFGLLGPTAEALGTGPDGFAKTLDPPYYTVGVIAGRKARRWNEDLLPGDDDGLVTVESTKIAGMTDFVLVNVGHAALRWDENVADYTITFLETGRFRPRGTPATSKN